MLIFLLSIIALLLTTNILAIFFLIDSRRQVDELSGTIHVTAQECYDIGWDNAMETVRETSAEE